jgi:hypothetical protein
MDFVDGLPTSRSISTIIVVVDGLSKYSRFIPFYDGLNIFYIYILVSWHARDYYLRSCDQVFTSFVWKNLFLLNGVKFNFSSVYHPRTDD